MAVTEMKKIRLLGLKAEEDTILNALHSTNAVELKSTEDYDGLFKGFSNNCNGFSEKTARLLYAINLIEDSQKEIKKYKETKKDKKPLFTVKGSVSFHDFTLITAREYEIFSYVEALENFGTKLSHLKSENAKQHNLISQLRIFKDIDAPLNFFKDTQKSCILLGTIPVEAEKPLIEYFSGQQNAVAKVFPQGASCAVTVIYPICENAEHFAMLSSLGFTRVNFDYDKTAIEIIEDCRNNIEQITLSRKTVLEKILNLNKNIAEIKLLYDYYNLALSKSEYEKEFKSSAHIFVMEGFVPAAFEDLVKKSVTSKTHNVIIEVVDTAEGDNPPTYTQNSRLVAPFEAVTNMYSVPSPYERDPNMFVGIFFFLFFGIMLSDAGYGLLLAIGAFVLLRKAHMEKGMRKMVKIIALGGISTIIWGVLFGGFFAVTLGDDAISRFLLSLRWFNPMEQPLLMLGLCLGLGVFQILFGLGVKAAALIKSKKTGEALMDVGSWYLFFAAVAMLCFSMLPEFSFLSNVGMYVFYASLVVIVLTQGRNGKGIFGKILKGLAGLYGIVGYLSDILSYARLFGLGLASGVVGLVMNTIAGMLLSNPILFIFGVAILVGGHAFNIGINVLGAYIHNCRLQYIEFFSRFYQGGGHTFSPYGSNLKYYNIK